MVFALDEADDFALDDDDDLTLDEAGDFALDEADDFALDEADDFALGEADDFKSLGTLLTLTDFFSGFDFELVTDFASTVSNLCLGSFFVFNSIVFGASTPIGSESVVLEMFESGSRSTETG